MLARLPPLWRNLILVGIAALVLWFAWTVRAALNPLLIGLLFAYMLHPMVLSLERRGRSRKVAVNVIFCSAALLLGAIGLAVFWQGRLLWRDLAREGGVLEQLEERGEQGLVWAETRLQELGLAEAPRAPDAAPPQAPPPGDGPAPGDAEVEPPDQEGATPDQEVEPPASPLREMFADTLAWIRSPGAPADAGRAGLAAAGGLLAFVRVVFGSLLSFLGWVLLVPIYTWFLLFELERIGSFVRGYVPRAERPLFSRIGRQITEMLGNFFRGRVLVLLVKGLVLVVVMWVAGVPYAILLGMLSGVLSIVPFAGPAIGYGIAFLLCLLEFTPLSAAIRIAIVFSIGELIEGYVLIPKVMGDSMGLHPVVVLAAFMIAGSALGMFGLLLALPLTATVIILGRELVLPALRDMAEQRSAGARSPPPAL